MRFETLSVHGAYLIHMARAEDERGYFARTWCRREFAAQGLCAELAQTSVSFNPRRGTLRGLHFQCAPHQEAKLVRCVRGRLYDVVLDLRPTSPTYLRHAGIELCADDDGMMYVPEGCAHGFLTLVDATEATYHISSCHQPEAARGVRWNDPAFGIAWPGEVMVISERDRSFPNFQTAEGSSDAH